MARALFAISLLGLAGCGGGGSTEVDGAPAVRPDGAAGSPDGADRPPDGAAGCAGEAVPVADITGTEGLAIAADGTLYYSQSAAVGRRVPGQPPDDGWVGL